MRRVGFGSLAASIMALVLSPSPDLPPLQPDKPARTRRLRHKFSRRRSSRHEINPKMRRYYSNLVGQGFSPDEALALVQRKYGFTQ